MRLACERHLRDLKDGHQRGLTFDLETANDAIAFFENFLCFYDGEFNGKPFLLSPWQAFIVGSLFGWKASDGYRRFRTAYIEIGKGNGKSPLLAGIGLLGLVADGEPGAEIYAAATTKDQAKILFRDAEEMVARSPELSELITRSINNLAVVDTASFFRPISSEKHGLDGKRVHMALIDEVHEHSSAVVVDKMRAGTKGRRQALIAEITNSGNDRESVCWQHHEYSRKVLQGIELNDSWFAYVCTLDPCPACQAAGKMQPSDDCKDCDDWRDPKVWPKANPNLGVSIREKYLQEQVAEAMGMPSKENTVKRLNACIWTERTEHWMPMDKWDACGIEFTLEELKGNPCTGGLDLASTGDFASFCQLFPPTDERPLWAAVWRSYIPEKKFEERVRKDPGTSWTLWKQQGWLVTTDSNTVDYEFIRKDIHEAAEMFQMPEIAYDRWNATQIVTQLMNDGFTMVPIGQGFASQSAPTSELMKLVLDRKFTHGGNKLARWAASNAAVSEDAAGNIKLDKEKSADKIDPMRALTTALARAMLTNSGKSGEPSISIL